MEIDQTHNLYHSLKSRGQSQLERRGEASKTSANQPRSTTCFKCSKEGHWAVECCSKTTARKLDHPSGVKPSKSTQHLKEMALKSTEVLELPQAPKAEDRALTPPDNESGMLETNYDNDPLVSWPIDPITMPIELLIPGTDRRMTLTILLNSGALSA